MSTSTVARKFLAYVALAIMGVPLAIWLLGSSAYPETSVDDAGRYKLVAADGSLFDRASLKGRPNVVYFGYTQCADPCRTMLRRVLKVRKSLGQSASDLPVVFISIDPAHDTPERLAAFAKELGAKELGGEIQALTGNPAVLDKIADRAGVFVRRVAAADGRETLDHTTSAFLYDRNDFFVDIIAPTDSDAAFAQKLQKLLAEPAPAASAKILATHQAGN
ncbi:SCO family protein [Novosphingobium sp. CECT 9465]|uniref:SCO family protein n=1 Tax=Novosphingobium sp. CECT 9465 TaxID=2829794 RepID=UPI001E35A09F|nr:SCO family protein [Novosphingobium sp. CECT 9465]CAH0495690.1 hypothetical protein NVSP9465_00698 [Novosphingobium sp. CECT 9465]